MPTFTLDQLTTPLTRQEVQASIYTALATMGVDTTVWKSGSVVRTIIVAVSLVASAFSQLMALIARSGFLELSEGDWLALVAKFVYGVDKQTADFAAGEITLTNTGGGVFHFDPDDLIVANKDTGKTYRNTQVGDLAAFGTLVLNIAATEAGTPSNAAAGAITKLVTSLTGVECTNVLPLVGRDDEEDPLLRLRCSEKLGALSPDGPWDAYNFVARNATRADGSNVGVTRVRITKDGFGNVFVYCATASGPVPGTVGDLTTDLGAVDEAIQQLAAPLGVTAWVFSAAAVAVSVTYSLWLYNTSGRTNAQIIDAVNARLTSFFSSQPVGGNVIDPDPGKIFVDAIRAAIVSTLPEAFHALVPTPAADVVLGVGDVAVFVSPATVTAITQVQPSEGHA